MTLAYSCSRCGATLDTTNADPLLEEVEQLRAVVVDMLAGLRYLRNTNSVPYGFGIDRLEQTGCAALGTWRCGMCGQEVSQPCGRNCPHDSR
jgi:rubrerythrin